MIKKQHAYICPTCGEMKTIDFIESSLEDGIAYERMRCWKCGEEWENFYSIQYCGYTAGNTVFNAKGDRIH